MENKKVKICVYAICKNEEKNVDEWLDRIQDADIIAITDTGSTDNTCKKIADKFNTFDDDKKSRSYLIKKSYVDIRECGFSSLRNKSLYAAISAMKCYEEEHHEHYIWILVSLDLDEFLNYNAFNEILTEFAIIHDTIYKYDAITVSGITNDNVHGISSSQKVDHKFIVCPDIYKYSKFMYWTGFVHEEMVKGCLNKYTGHIDEATSEKWNCIDLSNKVHYEHRQDLTKERNYYELLKIGHAFEKENTNARTLIYLAWEAYLHKEYDNFLKYTYECYDVLNMKPDLLHYKDEQIQTQVYFNEIEYWMLFNESMLTKGQNIYTKSGKLLDILSKDVFSEFYALHMLISILSSSYSSYNKNKYVKTRKEYIYIVKIFNKLIRCIINNYDTYVNYVFDAKEKLLYNAIKIFAGNDLTGIYDEFYNIKECYNGWIDNADLFNYNNIDMDIEFSMLMYNLSILCKLSDENDNIYFDKDFRFHKYVNKIDLITLAIGTNEIAIQKSSIDKNSEDYKLAINNMKYFKEEFINMVGDVATKINDSSEAEFAFKDPTPTSNPDVVTVEAPVMKFDEVNKNNNKICIYAITKNESKFVDQWCESMKEADSVVVLDTGSADDTVEKLRAHGVTVKVEVIDPWRFDVARNKALELVPDDCNILMSTDLDEILEPGWADIIRQNWIEGVHERGIYKYSWSHLENGESGRVFRYDKIHSRNWIWKYPVHELLWNTKTETNLYGGSDILDLFDKGVHLHHYPDMTKPRSSYLPLLELRAKEDPDDYYGLIYLAHEYYYRGMYEKSIETLDHVLTDFKDRCDSVEEASCYLFMGDSYKELKNYEKSKDSYLKAIHIDPTYREPYINIAKVLLDEKSYDIAEAMIKEGLKKSYRHFTWLERDASWSYEPYDVLSLICYYGGKKRESLLYAFIAYSMDQSNERLATNVNLILKSMTLEEIII